MLVSVRLAAQCRCVPVNSDVKPQSMSRNQFLVSFIVVSVLVGGFVLRKPIAAGELLVAIFGWSLAYFGSEMAALIRVRSTSASDQYIDPIIRALGWIFVLVVLALFVTRFVPKA
jgi:hypothetical protein